MFYSSEGVKLVFHQQLSMEIISCQVVLLMQKHELVRKICVFFFGFFLMIIGSANVWKKNKKKNV
jgi:hypothetical protein